MESIEEHPYFFQSGRYEGMSLEWVFVKNPLYISRIYRNQFIHKRNYLKRVENRLELAIDTLQKKLRAMDVVKMCPICKEHKVHYFLLPDRGQVNSSLISCEKEECKKELKSFRPGELYTISDFLLIIPYMEKREAKSVISIFKKSHPIQLLASLV